MSPKTTNCYQFSVRATDISFFFCCGNVEKILLTGIFLMLYFYHEKPISYHLRRIRDFKEYKEVLNDR